MKNTRNAILLAAILWTMAATSSSAGKRHYLLEDFSSSLYKDALNTTALWDTVSGTIGFYPFVVSELGDVTLSGQASGVALSGDIVLVADGTSGVRVVDATDPENPALIRNVTVGGQARDVIVDGDRAYVAVGTSGLSVINITNPASAALAATLALAGDAQGIEVLGNTVVVAAGSSGLHVIDVTSPSSPVLVGPGMALADARDVDLWGHVAYVANGSGGLVTVDLSNPVVPAILDTYATPGVATGIEVVGNEAYIAAGPEGLLVANVRDPANLGLLSSLATPGTASGVAVSGDFAYVGDSEGLYVVDISAPADPFMDHSFATASPAMGVAVSGDHAFVADTDGLRIVKVAGDFPPRYKTWPGFSGTPPTIVDGDHLYVMFDGLYVDYMRLYDISDPFGPSVVYEYYSPDWNYWAFTIQGNYLYAARQPEEPYGEPYRLTVYDITNPVAPVLVSELLSLDFFRDLAAAGDYLYSSEYVFNISNPAAPTVAFTMPNETRHPVLHGDYLFGTAAPSVFGDFFLVVYDISSPASPVYLGAPIDIYSIPKGAVVHGDVLYVADVWYLYAIDITNPASPVLLWMKGLGTYGGLDPLVAGDRLFESSRERLYVYDLSNPLSPALADSGVVNNYLDVPDAHALHGHAVFSVGNYFYTWRVFNNDHDYEGDLVQSSAIDDSDQTIVRLLFTPTGSSDIDWFVSADGGAHWEAATGSWQQPAFPGSDLRWKSKHNPPSNTDGGNTSATAVSIDWLFQGAVIDSIVDVPGDNGGWVRLHFTRSGYDFSGETSRPIAYYEIYRESDNAKVLTVFATLEEQYTARVPTLEDDAPTSYYIVAHSVASGQSFGSTSESGTSYDNVPPGVPEGLSAQILGETSVQLVWDDVAGAEAYRVYRGPVADFVLSTERRVAQTSDPRWDDSFSKGGTYYYRVTSLDGAGNESAPATSGPVVIAGPLPERFALYQNAPNPFNPVTTIAYDVPEGGGRLTLKIFDVAGRRVRTLLDGRETPGRKTVQWDGRDDGGRRVASGVYFYRIEALGYKRTLKMIVIE